MNFLQKNKNKKRNAIWRQLLFFVILLSLIYPLSTSFYRNYQKSEELQGDIDEYKNAVTDLKSKKFELRRYLDYVKSDEFVSQQARLSLNYKKQGEEVFVVKNDGEMTESGATGEKFNKYGIIDEKISENHGNNISKWRDYFFVQ